MTSKIRGLSSVGMSCVMVLIALCASLLFGAVKALDNAHATKPLVCACCSEEGEWYQRAGRVDGAQLVQLDRVRFSSTASTYLPPASDEVNLSQSYTLSHVREGRRWRLRFRDEHGKTGTISFVIPPSAVFFGADLYDQPPGGLGPALYKEWRFSGAAQVTGILRQNGKGSVRFHLILQGRGRGCTEAEDFKNWTLRLSGARVAYAFYGSLDNPQ